MRRMLPARLLTVVFIAVQCGSILYKYSKLDELMVVLTAVQYILYKHSKLYQIQHKHTDRHTVTGQT